MSISADSGLEGFKELSKKLSSMGSAVGGKILRQSVGAAVTPVLKEARLNAPQGDRSHKTHKGRLVAPGFLSRSIKKKTFKSRDGRYASAVIGVKKEAFYGVQFVERGYTPTDRNKKKHSSVDPNEWLTKSLESKRREVTNKLKQDMLKRILKAAR